MASQQVSVSTEPETGVPVAKMRELAHAAADQVYIDDYTSDNGFFDSLHGSLSMVNSTYSSVSSSLVDGQFDFDGTPPVEVWISPSISLDLCLLDFKNSLVEQAPPAPVGLRAQTLKAEIRDLENLRHKLEEREVLIKVI